MFRFDEMLTALGDHEAMNDYDRRQKVLENFRYEIAVLLSTFRGAQIIGQNGVPAAPAETCDLCSRKVEPDGIFIDGMINDGSMRWSNMCAQCFPVHGAGIGWGVGQMYANNGREWHCIGGGDPTPHDSEYDG